MSRRHFIFITNLTSTLLITENNLCGFQYAVLLILLLIIQICIGTYDFIALKDVKSVQKEVKENVQEMFDNYNATTNAREEMDNLQQLVSKNTY